jgi:parvulin-like peptidyl-prolyl isomerase
MSKHLLLIGAMVTGGLLAVGGRAADDSAGGLFPDAVLAKGQGVEVRRSRLDDAFIAFRGNLAARGQGIQEDRRLVVEAQLLDRLVVAQLLVNKATAVDKLKAKPKADNALAENLKLAGSMESLLRRLKSLGMTAEQFTNRVMEQAIGEEVLAREVKSQITITDEQAQQLYETNSADFRQPELATASHILIYTRDLQTRLELPEDQKRAKREKAEKALARAKQGEAFDKLVLEFSEDLMAKENKGEYQFTRAKDDPRRAMAPEFEAAAFALRIGDLSNLVQTEYGYHIIKLLKISPARKQPLAEVSGKIKEYLLAQETEKRLPAYFAKIKKDAGVELLDEKLKEALAKSEAELKK